MEFKAGDKVRFLNEKGGGVVVRMIDRVMALVAIEDGFEIPTLVTNLVLIQAEGKSAALFSKGSESNVKVEPQKSLEASKPPSKVAESQTTFSENFDPITKIYQHSGSQVVAKGVYLAFVPTHVMDVVLGDLEIFLINYTHNDLLFNFFSKTNDRLYQGVDYGSIPQHSKLLINIIKRDQIGNWCGGLVQILFHNAQVERVLMPLSQEFRIKPSRFYTEDSFTNFSLLQNNKALVYTLCELERLPSTVDQIMLEKSQSEPLPAAALKFKVESDIDRHQIAPHEAEVDLHISALRDDYNQFSPHQILQIQVQYFQKMLESAIAYSYRKIIFIHGIGNGSLKQMILGKLHDYESIEVRAASFQKYGNGAIEIVIHH